MPAMKENTLPQPVLIHNGVATSFPQNLISNMDEIKVVSTVPSTKPDIAQYKEPAALKKNISSKEVLIQSAVPTALPLNKMQTTLESTKDAVIPTINALKGISSLTSRHDSECDSEN